MYGGKLVGKRTRKPLSFEITELLFTDDGRQSCLLLVYSGLEESDLAPLYTHGQLVEQV